MPHPLLAGQLPAVASLPQAERMLTFLAAHTAAGQLPAIDELWRALPPTHHAAGVEAILQTLLFAGFPRAINAMAVVQSIGVAGELLDETGDGETWAAAGVELCGRIYGSAYTKLRGRMRELHPALDRWMVELGYGRVLSRAPLSPRLRELCVIAVLAGQNVPAQLESHLRGALRVGAHPEEVEAIVGQTGLVWGQAAAADTAALWQRCTPR